MSYYFLVLFLMLFHFILDMPVTRTWRGGELFNYLLLQFFFSTRIGLLLLTAKVIFNAMDRIN